MTRRTIQDLVEQAIASLPDNTSEAIHPAHVRNMMIDLLDTITPMYGGLAVVSRTVNLTTTPQVLVFESEIASYPPEWVADPANGTLSRSLDEVPAMTSKIWITGICEGPQGSELVIQLEKNGVFLNRQVEETMEGPTKSVGFALNTIDYGVENVSYRLMLSVPSGTATMTLRNVLFIGENVMVRQVPAVGRIA